LGFKRILGSRIGITLSGSREVTGHVTIRFHTGHVLLVLWNMPLSL